MTVAKGGRTEDLRGGIEVAAKCAASPASRLSPCATSRARSKREGTRLSDNVRQVECWFSQINNLRG